MSADRPPAPQGGDAIATADQTVPPAAPDTCARCGRRLGEHSGYRLPDGQRRCGRCVWRHRLIVRRALGTALIVGTILTAINQGHLLLAGEVSAPLLLRIGLTYLVPYCVSTSGAVGLAKVR